MWNTENASDGSHTIKAVGTYKNGRTQTSTLTVMVENSAPTPDTTSPTTPTSFAETADSETSISVSWSASTDNIGVTGYNLYKNGTFISQVSGTTYTFSSLTCGTTYSFAVEALDAAGNKSSQATLSAATEVCPTPEPPPTGLPFAEAAIRTGYVTITVPVNTQSITVPAGKDALVDLQGIKRTIGSLLVYGSSGSRIKIINGWWEITKPNDSSPYWRGGPRVRSSDGIGPEHVSLTNCLIQGSTVPDAIAIDTSLTCKVTIQKCRIESNFAWDGTDNPEAAEHCDALQVQGKVGALEVGLCTFYCMNVGPGNEGGKVFQLKNEGGNDGFTVDLNKVNMRGGGRTGTFFLQTTRDIVCTLTDVWAKDDGITTGANWNWSTSGGGMFYPNSSAGAGIAWTRSGTDGNYVADWPDASGIFGTIKQGVPSTGDYVTRASLGF